MTFNPDELKAFSNGPGHRTPSDAERQAIALERIAESLDAIAALLAAPAALKATGFGPNTPKPHGEPDADGWIEWHGHGVPPIADALTSVDYRMRNGEEATCAFYGLRWDHRDSMGDIIAYRIHKETAE